MAALGLSRHPSCGSAKSGWDPIYRKIVYHADPLSLYRNAPPELFAGKPPKAPHALPHEPMLPVADRQNGEADVPPEVADMHRKLAVKHVQGCLQELCSAQSESRKLFSCDLPGSALRLLTECLTPSQKQSAAESSEAGASAAREGTSAGAIVSSRELQLQPMTQLLVSEASSMGKVFFRVVHCGLSRAHLAAPTDFTSDDIGVFLLKPDGPEAADGSRRVDTSGLRLPSPVASQAGLTAVPLVLSLSTLTLSQLRSFAAWSETASVTAITESTTSVVAEAPAQFLRVSAEGALEDRSMFELVEMLQEEGWECVVARGSVMQKLCAAFVFSRVWVLLFF